MSPIPSGLLLHSLVDRHALLQASDGPASQHVAQVVCAWPVSGQYGFGTRLVYYALVATCVIARRTQWLKNACLAGALLLPSVAAVHAVVLAAVHVDSAVDMDIYGAFQVCSIAILAAPLTVYNSRTYFNDPGRNIIFLWTGLLLAGMLSLTIEFFRTNTHDCPYEDIATYPYNATCGLSCYFGDGGPFSPIRRDPTNNPSVIPAPNKLSFSTATLLAAGSAIPPIVTLIFTWEKILEINWSRIFGQAAAEVNDPIDGTNGATPKLITVINDAIRIFLSSLQIPIFTGIVIAILVVGEINFWSQPVAFQTEPFTSVGQWANVVATVLLIPGYLFYVEKERGVNGTADMGSMASLDPTPCDSTENNTAPESISSSRATSTRPRTTASQAAETSSVFTTNELIPLSILNKQRNTVATWLKRAGEYLGTPAPDRYDYSDFRRVQSEFPEIPGEAGRVANLEQIKDSYRKLHRRNTDADVTPVLFGAHGFSTVHRSHHSSASSRRYTVTSHTSPSRSSSALPELYENSSQGTDLGRKPRRDTLDVPDRFRPVHTNMQPQNSPPSPTASSAVNLDTLGSPKIVISSEPDETLPNTTPGTSSPAAT
ncbi:hypothetical protein GGS21DRAFT_544103 [Xylaria nigripes]|nr:hypothetical protein GGS21DRAFT_544103 [Xylaria nigripes]